MDYWTRRALRSFAIWWVARVPVFATRAWVFSPSSPLADY